MSVLAQSTDFSRLDIKTKVMKERNQFTLNVQVLVRHTGAMGLHIGELTEFDVRVDTMFAEPRMYPTVMFDFREFDTGSSDVATCVILVENLLERALAYYEKTKDKPDSKVMCHIVLPRGYDSMFMFWGCFMQNTDKDAVMWHTMRADAEGDLQKMEIPLVHPGVADSDDSSDFVFDMKTDCSQADNRVTIVVTSDSPGTELSSSMVDSDFVDWARHRFLQRLSGTEMESWEREAQVTIVLKGLPVHHLFFLMVWLSRVSISSSKGYTLRLVCIKWIPEIREVVGMLLASGKISGLVLDNTRGISDDPAPLPHQLYNMTNLETLVIRCPHMPWGADVLDRLILPAYPRHGPHSGMQKVNSVLPLRDLVLYETAGSHLSSPLIADKIFDVIMSSALGMRLFALFFHDMEPTSYSRWGIAFGMIKEAMKEHPRIQKQLEHFHVIRTSCSDVTPTLFGSFPSSNPIIISIDSCKRIMADTIQVRTGDSMAKSLSKTNARMDGYIEELTKTLTAQKKDPNGILMLKSYLKIYTTTPAKVPLFDARVMQPIRDDKEGKEEHDLRVMDFQRRVSILTNEDTEAGIANCAIAKYTLPPAS